jgi:glycerol-3-phosphate acyltransferase PlsX
MIRIALDAMGGDNAPAVNIEAAIQALSALPDDVEIVLVGDQAAIRSTGGGETSGRRLQVVDAPELIGMDEDPTVALRRKKRSSIAVAVKMVQNGDASAFVSAGNTGAVVASALLGIGRLPGIKRPAIAQFFPTETSGCVVIDVGANSDCRPVHLLQFGMMGAGYAELTHGKKNPTVGLLNIGEEKSKGSELYVEAHRLMSESTLNFIGNVEGIGILRGEADVVVCDGFTGNVILKLTESLIGMIAARLGDSVGGPAYQMFQKQMDYAEYGGAPLLGIKKTCVIAHGKSSVRAMTNAIKAAEEIARFDLGQRIEDHLSV